MDFCINQGELKEKSVQIILEKDESENPDDQDDTYKIAAIYIPE